MRARRLAKVGYLGLAALDTVLAGSSSPTAKRARFLTKPLLMPALATSLVETTPGRTDGLKRGTVAAQAFSWGGDLALLGSSERAFLAGVGSFFAAHVAYVGGFLSAREPGPPVSTTGPKIAGATWLLLAPVMSVAAGRKDPAFRIPIAAYSGVLTTMSATSTLLDRSIPRRARRKLVAGTTLFLLSDGILGVQEFLLKERRPELEAAVMATYTAGQWLISEGVAAAH